ncbi:hypothetical protein [Protaetiibacter mangrovi]|uniref:Uncharacterized protein n=1 Tax=Protaetiibacter mangrovi TaxID=2970926 RepID=A0ABT1ZBE1_9MICO|nr:hypothetical protein [Protaetiibacter mangrovi]MCS0498014.1 hypothetical protein [Protaetiibacter mangrovi]TPX02538.1 hypothetical protein FJ656_21865 [Schumannella luteola]
MIDWMAFLTVFVAALVSACIAVTLFSLGLRLGDGTAAWRRPVSVLMFVLCAAAVVFGLYLIVGDHLLTLFGA